MDGSDTDAARLTLHLDAAALWHHRPAYADSCTWPGARDPRA
jgi:hypothetical protein